MSRPHRFVFNHFVAFNHSAECYEVHEINGTLKETEQKHQRFDVTLYGTPIAVGDSIDDAIKNAVAEGIGRWDIKVMS